jgi:hypothetical protein
MKTERDKLILKECRDLVKKNPKLKNKKLDRIVDLDKRLYYYKVWYITESQPLKTLKNYEKRCFRGKSCYHLDHICSISEGYYRKIPPEIIGGIDNLRFIPSEKNMEKGSKVSPKVLHETLKKKSNYKKLK